jgi:hypothetical protein
MEERDAHEHGHGHRERMMNRHRLLVVFLAVFMLLLGFTAGRIVTAQQLTAANETNQSLSVVTEVTGTPTPPDRDVPGKDVSDLPRYPGAIRTEYRQETINDLLDTEVEYLVAADLEAVHDYYRTIFDEEGWTVADLGIHMGEWTFFVISGSREALVELEVEYGLVEIEIEMTEPAMVGE